MTHDVPSDKSKPKKHLRRDIQFGQALFERARERALSIFSDWEWTPPGEGSFLSIPGMNGEKPVLNVAQEVVPPLAFAEHYFGSAWPDSLTKKLRNKTQTLDTLFELVCLGLLNLGNKVVYEPRIGSGKVPDMLIEPLEGPHVYVECKSHRFTEAKYWRAFNSVSAQVCEAIGEEPLVKAAWNEQLRTEVYLKGRPTDKEIEASKRIVATLQMQQLPLGCDLSERIAIKCVSRTQVCVPGASLHCRRMTVPTESTELGLANAHIVVYPWPGLDKQRRSAQRALLKEARLKLREIPAGSLGMICIQTVSTKAFLPDVHALIDQKQFSFIPIIWLNPSVQPVVISTIVFRDGADQLVDRLLR